MSDNRRIRVFVSSTFRDMVEERNELMTHTWPELRRFCRGRQVELVEVDLRWGIAEEQSIRKETLKLCLDEICACRPFFIGLLGERYGWMPGDDAFTADLTEEQPWLRGLSGKSVTELEILHGVLNNPGMASRSFFYFRDPAYAQTRGADFLSEEAAAAGKQTALKENIAKTCEARSIPLHLDYSGPRALAALVLNDLQTAIKMQFPIEEIPDPLTREAWDHEAFAETRRRTYIGRPEFFDRLDRHALGDGGPLVLLGDSGSGKSALLANWIAHWRLAHPRDFIFQHYIGGAPDSTGHWHLLSRLIGGIKHWTEDPDDVPRSEDELVYDFPAWLAKARIKAERDGTPCILVLDALNQLEEGGHARQLGWLPSQLFFGPLRLVVSTQTGEMLQAVQRRGWESLRVEPLTAAERCRMIEHYLARFGKKLNAPRIERLAGAPAAANPLYLKILLDELRITGTYDRLDERLNDYLAAEDIPALLKQVLSRYQRDYERDRPGLVSESLGLICASRRGLSETEILHLLKPPNLPQLPLVIWSPLRAALEEGFVDRGGILNFAHDFLRIAVETAFVIKDNHCNKLRPQLADYFEHQAINARSCDELPWLLWKTEQRENLRACLLDFDRFLEILKRDPEELMRYWVELGEERAMGTPYLASCEQWSKQPLLDPIEISYGANALAFFLDDAALHVQAEPLMRRALTIDEQSYGPEHPNVAIQLNNLGRLLRDTNRVDEAEPLMRRALTINERSYGPEHPSVAVTLNSLARLLHVTSRLDEAEFLMRRALTINERGYGPEHPDVAAVLVSLGRLLQDLNELDEAEASMRRALAINERNYGPEHPNTVSSLDNLASLLYETNRLHEAEPLMRHVLALNERNYGSEHPNVAINLNNLAVLVRSKNQMDEAERLMRRALTIDRQSYGLEHPNVARDLRNLARLFIDTNRIEEAEPFARYALTIDERSYGPQHPNVAVSLSNLALVFRSTNRLDEAEPLMRRALAIDERCYGLQHPNVANRLNDLASLLQDTNRLDEAEPLMRRALLIFEKSLGEDHPYVATGLNNLADLLQDSNRLDEAEPLMRRHLEIFLGLTRVTGVPHLHLQNAAKNYATLLHKMGQRKDQILATLSAIGPELFR